MTTPPGWYPDPSNNQQQRYWNGSAWTDQTQPAAPAMFPPPPAAGSVIPSAPPTARDGRAQAKADRAYRKASRPWPLRHPILTALAALILIIIIAVAATGGGGESGSPSATGDETAGKVLQHSEDVEISKCARDNVGYLYAQVTITNHSSKASDYVISVAFEDKATNNQIETGDSFVSSLQPGQTTTKRAVTLTKHKAPFKCVLSDATRTASF